MKTFQSETDQAVRSRLEEIIETVCAEDGLPKPQVFWCSSAVEAHREATLAVLERELRRVLDEGGDWDFDIENVDRVIAALKKSSPNGFDNADLIEGSNALLTCGGLYGTPPRHAPWIGKLEERLEELGFIDRREFDRSEDEGEEIQKNFLALDRTVEANAFWSLSSRIDQICHLTDELRLAFAENLQDSLMEASGHFHAIGPEKLCGSPLFSRLGAWWIYAYENAIWVSDGPQEMHFDQQGLLHHDSGPAIDFGEGHQGYCWHGELVPDSWIAGELTGDDINMVNIYAVEYFEIAPHRAPEVLTDILNSKRNRAEQDREES